MNILYSVFTEGWGGLEKYPLTLKEGMESRGHKIFIVTIKNSRLHLEAEKNGIKVFTIEVFKKFSFDIIKKLNKFIIENNIDVVHLNSSRELYNWYMALRDKKNIRCCLTFHIGVPKHKDIIHKIMYKRVDKIFAISSVEADEMHHKLALDSDKIEIMHNGVDLSKFINDNKESKVRRELNLDEDTKIITAIGNLSKPKGILEWIKAAEMTLKKYSNVCFLWVGDDTYINEEYSLNSLKKELEIKKLDKYIKLLGYRNDIIDILKVSDIFVLPAHKESFGIVYIEAMAMGLPVIGCNSGGVPDIITEKNGWLCEPKNIDSLYKIFLKALESDLYKFSEYNKKYVDKFSMENHIEKLLNNY